MSGLVRRCSSLSLRESVGLGPVLALLLLAVLSSGAAWTQDRPEHEARDLPPEAGQSWLSEVQRRIQAAEHEVTWQDHTVLPGLEQAWHAPNRSQNLRTYFTGEGIRVVRRTETEPSWELSLSLLGYGRGAVVSPVGAARLVPSGNRIDYERGQVVEWYVNDSRGLEQGFTLHGPPEDTTSTNAEGQTVAGGRDMRPGETTETPPAFLVLALGGSLSPVISTDGQAIDFAAPGGARVLHYAALKVTDAGGRELPARMEGFADAGVRGIRIVFDDAEAAYPVTVDPLLTTPAWTSDGEQDNASFGYYVATAGDVNGDGYSDVIVGAYRYDNGDLDEGLAIVYHGSAGGLYPIGSWSEEGNQAGAAFGRSVATAGDVNGDGYSDVVVGAYLYTNGQSGEGRAFVYHGSASGLSSTADWTAESDQAGASLGVSVSTAGDVNGDGYSDVIVGAHMYDDPESNEGLALVYHGSAGGLYSLASWSADGDQVSANFGWSVSTAGDVNGDGYADVIIGARSYDNGETDEGGAWVYLGSASGLSAAAAWSDESDQAGARMGHSVSTAGDVNGDGYADVVVGNYRYTNDQTEEGRAQVYHGSPSGPSATPDWIAEGNQTEAYLGVFVSTAGDVNGDGYADLIVGAHGYDNPEVDEGMAFVYHGSPSGLGPVANWTAESDQADAMLGASVSTAGDVNGDGYADVVIGAPYYTNGYTEEGRAYVYHGSPAGLSPVAGWSAESNQSGAEFGCSVSTAGDVNGDGYADVIVGAYRYDNGEAYEGRAYLYQGSPAGLSATADWTAEGNRYAAYFGFSVSTAADVNGDGYADVIVGAYGYDNPYQDEGKAFVYHGSPSGLAANPAWTAESDTWDAEFGHSVSTAGDVNGDGYADVIVGAPLYEVDTGDYAGRAYVYHGSPAGLDPYPAWTADGEYEQGYFGGSVSTAGDVNGDGYADVIVGAEQDRNYTGETVGRVYVYHGSPSGLGTVAAWTEDGQVPGISCFGASVSTAGDVNGDGYADVIVGDDQYYDGGEYLGKVYVYHGWASGLNVASWTVEGDHNTDFGNSVSTAGDVNGDGYADVIVAGAQDYTNDQSREGRAYVYHGSASGSSTTADWIDESNQTSTDFGISVSTAGDVNGDGYAEVIVGASWYDNPEFQEGKAFLYYGNAGTGLSVRPQQRRADDLSPVAAGGRSHESGSFRLAALGHTPFGRGRVKLEWEVKPLGQSFDGSGTGQTEWTDTGAAGATFNELISGLEPGGYHWRMRLLYDTATTPLAGASRWFTVPWNGWQERDLTVSPFIGGKVWEDYDWDGLMESGEPGLWGVMVSLLDETGTTLQVTITDSNGEYRFDVGSGGLLKVRFELPDGWYYTLPDQGIDDFADSDADTVTGETALIMPPFDSLDELRWSAGLRGVGICTPPDEPVYIYSMRLSTDGNDYPILDFQDPNQPGDVTGYNVYRSSDDGLPPGEWPLIADDVVDMDEAEPNKQWVDTTGDEPPGGIWYYQVTAYNHNCPAEGPR